MYRHFLYKDPFGDYLGRIYYEWLESYDEGKDVEAFRAACSFLQDRFLDGRQESRSEWSKKALELGHMLQEAPYRKDYPYVEPSDLEGIIAESSFNELEDKKCAYAKEEMMDHLLGAWTGDIAGCMLGKPIEFMRRKDIRRMLEATDNYPMDHYPATSEFSDELIRECGIKTGVVSQPWIDEWDGMAAPVDDDTNYSVLNMKLMHVYGKDFEPNDVLHAWMSWLPAQETFTAERAAYANGIRGILAPESAVVENPCREWIGALIRAAAFGMVYPGECRKAARAAFNDACISHTKNGIYGEMMAAVMIAKAMVCGDVRKIVEEGMKTVPKRSRLYEDVSGIIRDFDEGKTYEEAIDRVHEKYDENSLFYWCHTNPNAMILTAALLYGKSDFALTISNGVTAGFDTDSATQIIGCIIGAMLGKKKIPDYWGDSFRNRLYSSVKDHENRSVEELAQLVYDLITDNYEPDERVKHRYDSRESFE